MAETKDAEIKDFVHQRCRSLDAKIDQMLADQRTANRRLSSIEECMTKLERQEGVNFVVLNDRLDIVQKQLDGVSDRLERIETSRRLSMALKNRGKKEQLQTTACSFD